MENPFKYGVIVRGPYFADRTEELAELVGEMNNRTRVFLISPRRFGKTCLLFNLMDKLRDLGFATAYLDLNAYPDVRSLAVALTHLTSKALESNTDKLTKIFSRLQRLRPKVSVGHDGSLTATVDVAAEVKDALPALLEGMQHAERLARKRGKKLVVVIDEFSDLPKYDGQTLEKALRAELQKHDHIGYILSGSEQSVMLSMIRDSKRAFYKLGRIMALGAIDRRVYTEHPGVYGLVAGAVEIGVLREQADVEPVTEAVAGAENKTFETGSAKGEYLVRNIGVRDFKRCAEIRKVPVLIQPGLQVELQVGAGPQAHPDTAAQPLSIPDPPIFWLKLKFRGEL